MTTKVFGIRIEPGLMQEIDEVEAELRRIMRGVGIKRSAVIRMLIRRGLDDFRKETA